ncbi:hypothetical protein UCRPC4_g06288 [Phaeomoniella chlamydospora]|uniref:Mitochondrial pyruvate carrier n=1 Tax=Phaeomoniella chlamydospora TaxID=158046 RepID=A0A0G2FUH9_PHACM|nr:hypothetical protein UCRPC4_g06288 [Phaeomoniella chlamydospora]
MSSRVGLRFYSQAARSAAVRAPFRHRQAIGRRFATTDATASPAQPQESIFKRLWTSEVGVKTVHFWAPVMKWALVVAGIGDFFRPAEKLSLTQNAALTATGSIWTRWCFIIRPKNLLLAAVNAALACVGVVQVTRILLWQRSQSGSTEAAVKDLEVQAKDSMKKLEGEIKNDIKKVA